MGEAQDAVFAREGRKQAAEKAAQDRKIRELRAQIKSYVPKALDRLRQLGWPDGPYPIQRKTLRINGEERVGWVVYTGWGQEHMLYLLGDGSFAREFGSTVIAEPGDTIDGLEEAEGAIEGIRVLAEGGMPVTRGVVSPPLW